MILQEEFEKYPTDISHAIDSTHSKFINLKSGSCLISIMCKTANNVLVNHNINPLKLVEILPTYQFNQLQLLRRRIITGARDGRPAKCTFEPEHGYGKGSANLKICGQTEPHSLRACVDRNRDDLLYSIFRIQ